LAPFTPLNSDKATVEANLLKEFSASPQIVQIGDVLVSSNNLFRVIESEFSEDTDFMQKVLDFTPAGPVEEQE